MTVLARIGVTLVLLLAALNPAGAVERILLFVSDVTVERNGDLAVSETIAVQAEGREIRRGILRDFPTSYRRPDGARVEVGFEVLSVTRDGNAEDWTTERLGNGVRVRIGNASRLLNTGRHDYVIRYRTTRQIGFFSDYDELYWNATGNGWTFAIDQAEARITLPEAVPFRQSALYTGPQGGRGRDATIVEQRPGRIVFRTTRALPAQNGLTVAAAWQKGLVTPPSALQQADWLLRDNVVLLVALAGLALVIAFYVFAWLRVGRDPPRGTIIPLFGPPDGMSAAAVRYVDQMGFDNRAFTAAIIDLGVSRRVKLVESGDSTEIKQTKGGKPIGPAEQALEKQLFASGSSIQLVQSNHRAINKAQDALKNALEQDYTGKLFANNYGWSGWGMFAALLVIVAIVVAIHQTYGSDDAVGAIVGMLIPVIPVMIGAGMVRTGWRRHSGGTGLLIGGLAIALGPAAIGLAVMYANSRGLMEVLPGVAPPLLAACSGLAFGWLQAPSLAGRKIMDQIDGFREYLGVAEEERLEYLNPPEKTPELFERFLPYAVALDVENTWGKRFAGVLAAAAAGAAAHQATTAWYSGDRDFTRDPAGFAEHLGSDLNQTISSASTAPGSSSGGSGGGGSSGGGGGGGGGSGW